MEFSAEDKAKMEVPLKAALKQLVDFAEVAGSIAAKNSENKIDDLIIPVLSPMAKDFLYKMIDSGKL
jgi:hypothetical protein